MPQAPAFLDSFRRLFSFQLKTRKYMDTSHEKMLVLYGDFYYNKKRSVKVPIRCIKIPLRNRSAPGGHRAAGAVKRRRSGTNPDRM